MSDYEYDLVVIGGGSGGVRASRLAGAMGKKVAVIEEDRVGGTCVLRGCVPKKLLVYASHFSHSFEDAAGFGWTVGERSIDWGKLVATKNVELDRLNGIYNNLLGNNNVEIVLGRGTVVDAHTVKAGDRTLTAETILIAVGGWPTRPEIPGIEHTITSNEALELTELPERVLVVGGGYIAVEFAGIFNSAGAKVTEVIRGPQILRGFDQDMRDTLAAEMVKQGIDLRTNTVVEAIEKTDKGLVASLSNGDTIEADVVMYATGRKPKTPGLGLEEAGVKLDDAGAVMVDEFNRTSVPSIWAVGDVTNRVQLTPVALAEGMAFIKTLYEDTPTSVDYGNIPSAVFSQPPIGTVGLPEHEAKEKFGEIDVYTSSFKPMKHTLSGRDERSFMKLIVDPNTDLVVGAHMMGEDAAEILQGIGIAMKAGATKAVFDATIGIHPSSAEEFCTMRTKRAD